ncbi:Uncharacterised protein [Mesomycoplasma hyorhinis]|uniref:Uncharacterized protein n=1 Tax=Mesomycoplasma hyorhinis (strain MCLD) TaxID=936139 RepID=A0ABM5M6R4_MESHM|nr:hypothetical protein SRH_03445 [Mesomycoplasma hyorhinis MCLD]AEX14262.1 hypothetical protein MYM_0511 [Mesomycoplasma hyorhinis GDL-1]SYV91849.1 Uncharacterised protein [Mesomycoplasma hyorhinis]
MYSVDDLLSIILIFALKKSTGQIKLINKNSQNFIFQRLLI